MSFDARQIAKDYSSGQLNGWLGKTNPQLLKASFKLLGNSFSPFFIRNQTRATAGQKMFLYWVTRKLFGKDTPNYPQEIGDCVSFGAKNGTEYVSACEKLMKGIREQWRPVFPPYYYGTGRIYVGGQENDYQDGSLGSWMAAAVMKYGTLFADEKDVPKYSGNVAKEYGAKRSILDQWKPTAINYPVQSAAQINSWDDLVAAIVNGYSCPTASDIGYDMEAGRDGFHAQTTSWGHQMCLTPYTITSCVNPKEIQNIFVGEKVFGHDGQLHKVTQVYKRYYDGEIVSIKVRANLPLQLTPNHSVLVLRKTEEYSEEKTDGNLILAINKKTKLWINAGEIKLGDELISPRPELNQEIFLPEGITPNDKLGWLFGLYAADGGATANHKICITLAKHEMSQAKLCAESLKYFNLQPHIYEKKNCIRVVVYSAKLANLFIQWFGKGKNKHLPEWLLSNKWNLQEVINGIFVGDGGFVHNSKVRKRIVNTSRTLIEQCKLILQFLDKKPSIGKHQYKNKIWNDKFTIEWVDTNKYHHGNYWKDNEFYQEVIGITKENYKGVVYNLEVEDVHTYLAEGLVVHNCFIGVDETYSEPYALILNSWGDSHGHLKDFQKPEEELPIGILRVRRKDAEKHIRAGETFAYSNFKGFPEQLLDKALFDLIGA